jgi:TRAP transporter TAXI family solute receptor
VCLGVCSCTNTTGTERTSHRIKLARTTSGELKHALERLPNITAEVTTDGGSSITSLIDLRDRKTDVAVPVADVAYLAYAGQLDEMEGRFDELRGMAVTGMNPIHLLIAPGVPAKSPKELAGLHISLGAPGSSTALVTERLLQRYGITRSNMRAEKIPNGEMLKQLAQGKVDAAFVMFSPPNQSVAAAMKSGVRFIGIEGPVVEEMRTQYPYLKRTLVPAGTYPNQSEPVRTIGIDLALVCRADLDEDLVYSLLDAYFATRPEMTPPNLDRAPATPVPLHPGAARYYRQRELAR